MSSSTKILTTVVGIAYLFIGLAVFPAPAMFLTFVPKNELASTPFLINLGVLILVFGPCLLIGYAWIRNRRWGRYLLIAYNGIGFMYFSFAFVQRMTNDSVSDLGWVTTFLTILIVLGGLVGVAFQKDVRALMNQ